MPIQGAALSSSGSWGRLLSRDDAGRYLGVSGRAITGMFAAGILQPVRLPGGRGSDTIRRALVDRLDLDRLVDQLQADRRQA